MKKVEYSCNLCGEKRETKELKALYWDSAILPQRYRLVSEIDKSDKHLCTQCINLVKDTLVNSILK